jgi:regulator of sigma E protease
MGPSGDHALDISLIAMTWLDAYGWFMAAVGLGVVIFVHELGHFLVARMCGVKCEKFYLGFDVFGASLVKWRWGETEYGIGAFPLGGYVKMLGQDDNPANTAKEIERSKQTVEVAERNGGQTATATAVAPVRTATAVIDPRSYLAKSVPQRMAIISAGVIMNLIFAVVFAMIAYRMGVQNVVAEFAFVVPGQPAWQVGLMPGDRIVQIGDHVPNSPNDLGFSDLIHAVALGNVEEGVRLKIERPGDSQPFWVTALPKRQDGRPKIGASPAYSLQLFEDVPVFKASPAGKTGEFQGGDTITAVDGQAVTSERELLSFLVTKSDQPLTFTVQRKDEAKAADENASGSSATITVPPNPVRTLGLQMKLGPVLAVQDGSPAAKAGLRAGDILNSINGETAGDPLTLPERLRRLGGQEVTLGIQRPETNETLEKKVTLRAADWYEPPVGSDSAVGVPALGIAYRVLADVQAVEPGSPAAEAGLKPGDVVKSAKLVWTLVEGEEDLDKTLYTSKHAVEMSEEEAGWPWFMERLQSTALDVKAELVVQSGDETKTVTLGQVESAEFFQPERGFQFRPKTVKRVASSIAQAFNLGWRETVNSVGVVYQTIQRLASNQVSTDNLGGPGTIVVSAGMAARQSLPDFLMFLTMLSANLAVLNFLPIPVLDGGHMVFLAYEGLRGKPPSEKVMVALSYAGLFLLLVLMLYVVGLDVKRLFQWLGWLAPG